MTSPHHIGSNEEWIASAAAEDFTGTVVRDEDLVTAVRPVVAELPRAALRPVDLAAATARALLSEARETERVAKDEAHAASSRLRVAEDDMAWWFGSAAAAHGYQAQSYDVGGGSVYFEGDAQADPSTWHHVDDGTLAGAWVREVDLHVGGRLAVWDTRAPSVCDHLRRQEPRYRAEICRSGRVGPRVAALSEADRKTLTLVYAPPRLCMWDGKAKALWLDGIVPVDQAPLEQVLDVHGAPCWLWERGVRKIEQRVAAMAPGDAWRLVGAAVAPRSWRVAAHLEPGALVSASDGVLQGLRDAFVRRTVTDQVLDEENRGVWTWVRRPKVKIATAPGEVGKGRRAKIAGPRARWSDEAGGEIAEESAITVKPERTTSSVPPKGDGWERETPVLWTATSVSTLFLALETRALAVAHAKASGGRLGAPAYDRVGMLAEIVDGAQRRRLKAAQRLLAQISAEATARLDGALERYMAPEQGRPGVAKTRPRLRLVKETG